MRKNRTKIFPLFLGVLILAIALCSCAANSGPDPENTDEQESTAEGYLSEDACMITGVDGLMNGSRANMENGRYILVQNEDGSSNIIYTDYSSRTRLYLCSRPECTHNNSSCLSWLSPEDCKGGAGPITDGERLYIQTVGQSQDGPIPVQMLQMDLDGGNREVLFRLDAASTIGSIAKDHDKMYFMQQTAVPAGDTVQMDQQLMEFDTVTKKAVPLKAFEPGTYLYGVCPAGFILKTLEYRSNEDGADTTLLHTIYLYRPLSDAVETVEQWEQQDVLARVHNRLLYSLNIPKATLIAVDPDTKQETTIARKLPIRQNDTAMYLGIHDDHFCFRVNKGGSFLDKDVHYYSVDLHDGSVTESTLQYKVSDLLQHVLIVAENSTYFLVHYNEEPVTIQQIGPDGAPYPMDFTKAVYGLILKDDYWTNTPNYIPIQDLEDIPVY